MDSRDNGTGTSTIKTKKTMSHTHFYKLPTEVKKDIYAATRDTLQLTTELAVEKDWWAVHSLRTLFGLPIGEHLLFKGGTSLSKAWGVIERFSEDVDLVLDRSFLGYGGEISRRDIEKLRIDSLAYITDNVLPDLQSAFHQQGFADVEIRLDDIERENEDPVVLWVDYPSVVSGTEYIRDSVKLEIGCRSLIHPQTDRDISSYISEAFPDRNFSDSKIRIPCVNPERTFLEKLFLLHEEFQRPADKIRVKRLSRHLYDIERLSNTAYAAKAIADKQLYKTIVDHRYQYTRVGGVDYTSHYPPNLNPIPMDNILALWEKDYETMQKEMIHGDSLPFDELIAKIKWITNEINRVLVK